MVNQYMKLILILLLLIATSVVSAQHMRETDRIYWVTLHEYTVAVDSSYSKYIDQFKDKCIYLQKPEYVDSIPSKVNGYNIILITSQNIRKLYKEHNNHLIHTKMFPVAIEDSTFYITITPYRGELRKRNHYNLAVSDGTTVHFKYDCDKRKFVVYKVDN